MPRKSLQGWEVMSMQYLQPCRRLSRTFSMQPCVRELQPTGQVSRLRFGVPGMKHRASVVGRAGPQTLVPGKSGVTAPTSHSGPRVNVPGRRPRPSPGMRGDPGTFAGAHLASKYNIKKTQFPQRWPSREALPRKDLRGESSMTSIFQWRR